MKLFFFWNTQYIISDIELKKNSLGLLICFIILVQSIIVDCDVQFDFAY